MGEETPSKKWKKGCLWTGGSVAAGFIVLTIIAGVLAGPDIQSESTDAESGGRSAGSTASQTSMAALKEARRAINGINADAWPELAQTALDVTRADFDNAAEATDSTTWALAWIVRAATNLAVENGNAAQAADSEYLYEFAASLGDGSLESCEALNRARRSSSRSVAAFDAAIAALGGEALGSSVSSEDSIQEDCSALEPLKLGPGGSSMEPDMTYDFAAENATYFTGRCSRQVSQVMPVVEQQRCFSTGEKAFRFFRHWVPQADPEWVNASASRRAQLEQAAEAYRQNVTTTLETLGWMRGGMPSFSEHRFN